MSEGERTLFVRVEGKVQGVYFRAFTRANAMRLGIKGWIVNCEDGAVEAAVHGPGNALAELVGLMRRGPPAARVDSLDVRSAERGRIADVPRDGYSF